MHIEQDNILKEIFFRSSPNAAPPPTSTQDSITINKRHPYRHFNANPLSNNTSNCNVTGAFIISFSRSRNYKCTLFKDCLTLFSLLFSHFPTVLLHHPTFSLTYDYISLGSSNMLMCHLTLILVTNFKHLSRSTRTFESRYL